jgi:hypothetical protein
VRPLSRSARRRAWYTLQLVRGMRVNRGRGVDRSDYSPRRSAGSRCSGGLRLRHRSGAELGQGRHGRSRRYRGLRGCGLRLMAGRRTSCCTRRRDRGGVRARGRVHPHRRVRRCIRIRSRRGGGRYRRGRPCRHRSQCRSRRSGRARSLGSFCLATRRQCFGFRLQRGNCAKIVRLCSCCQGTRINLPHFSEKHIGLVFGRKRAEAQAVARPSVLGALYLIHVGGRSEFGQLLRRLRDRRGGCTQIDHEGSRAPEAWHLFQRLEQVLDA